MFLQLTQGVRGCQFQFDDISFGDTQMFRSCRRLFWF